jgi:hypothetical protein
MKLWILKQTFNEYDQPDNNLCAIWTKKPDIYTLAFAIVGISDLTQLSESALIAVVSVLKGEEVRWDNADYLLKEIEEGVLP